jgi:hypothetical protein
MKRFLRSKIKGSQIKKLLTSIFKIKIISELSNILLENLMILIGLIVKLIEIFFWRILLRFVVKEQVIIN